MKHVSCLLAVVIVLAIAGCGGDDAKTKELQASNQKLNKRISELQQQLNASETQRLLAERKVQQLEAQMSSGSSKTGATSTKGGDQQKKQGQAGQTTRKPFAGLGGRSIPETLLPVYFYDTNTGKFFSGIRSQIPPIQAPSDKGTDKLSGVRAHIWSCDACDDENKRVILYLQKFSPEAKAKIEKARDEKKNPNFVYEYVLAEHPELEEGHFLRLLEDGQMWVTRTSDEGRKIENEGLNKLRLQCQGLNKRLKECRPK